MDNNSERVDPSLMDIHCSKCGSDEIGKHWVDTQQILHCICIACTYEWVE